MENKKEESEYKSLGEFYISKFLEIININNISTSLDFEDYARLSLCTKGLYKEVGLYCDFQKWVGNYGLSVDKKYAKYVFYGYYNYENELKEYQKNVVKKMGEWKKEEIYGLKGGVINMKMRMGKTITSLTFILMNYKGDPSLIICKKSDIDTWETEIKKFFKNRIKYIVLDSSKKIKIRDLNDKQLVLTTYGYVRNVFKNSEIPCLQGKKTNLRDEVEEELYTVNNKPKNYVIVDIFKNKDLYCKKLNLLYTRKWDNIICDECNNISVYNTLTFKAVSVLYANSYYGLTGTLIYNKMLELFCIYKFMDLDINFKDMKNISKMKIDSDYLNNYSIMGHIDTNKKYNKVVKCNKERVYRLSYKDVDIQVPEIKSEQIYLNFIGDELKLYDFYRNKFFDHYTRYKKKKEKFNDTLVIMTRLRQICIDPSSIINNTIDEFLEEEYLDYLLDKQRSFYNSTKIKYCLELIKSILDEDKKNKILVFSSFSSTLEKLVKIVDCSRIIDGKVNNKKRIESKSLFMNDDGVRVLFLSYKTSAFGLNLSSATHVILLEPAWNSATEYQAIARCFIIGQISTKKVISLIINNSIEFYMLNIQRNKDMISKNDEFFEEFKEKQSSTAKKLAEAMINDYTG